MPMSDEEAREVSARLAHKVMTDPGLRSVAVALAREMAEDETLPADDREVCRRFVAEEEEKNR